MIVQNLSVKGKRLYAYISSSGTVEFKIDSIQRSDLYKFLLDLESDIKDLHDIMNKLAGYEK